MEPSKEKITITVDEGELTPRQQLIKRWGEATVNILFPLLEPYRDENGKPIIYRLLNDDRKENERIELQIDGHSTPIKGSQKVRKIEGRVRNFEPSVVKVLLKAMSESEDEDDKANEGKYYNGTEYTQIPEDFSEFERGLLKSRIIKHLLQQNRILAKACATNSENRSGLNVGVSKESSKGNVVTVLSSLYNDLSERMKTLETNGHETESFQRPFNMLRLGDFSPREIEARQKREDKLKSPQKKFKSKESKTKETAEPQQLGMTNRTEDGEDKPYLKSFKDIRLRDFVK